VVPLSIPKRIITSLIASVNTRISRKKTRSNHRSIAARTPYPVSRNIIILAGLSREEMGHAREGISIAVALRYLSYRNVSAVFLPRLAAMACSNTVTYSLAECSQEKSWAMASRIMARHVAGFLKASMALVAAAIRSSL